MSTPAPATISPSDPDWYADPALFPLDKLEALAARAARDGGFIAANEGADHPLAVSWRNILVAVNTAILIRLFPELAERTADA